MSLEFIISGKLQLFCVGMTLKISNDNLLAYLKFAAGVNASASAVECDKDIRYALIIRYRLA